MIFFQTSLKVRTYECDFYGHVNNATFLNYCEYARVDFLSYLGYNLQVLKDKGFLLPIVKIEIEYKQPVVADETLRITVKWLHRGRSSSVFEQEIYKENDQRLAARALVTWVVTDLSGKPISIPVEMLEKIQDRYGELPPKRKEINYI